jgi:DNA-directed RNA polymerase subunit N (RpoN/RPB10)
MNEFKKDYRQWPIKCQTCGRLVDCYSNEYCQLLESGSTVKQALDEMKIMMICCRKSFMCPTSVMFDCQNLQVVEGIVKASDANFMTRHYTFGNPVFGATTSTDKPDLFTLKDGTIKKSQDTKILKGDAIEVPTALNTDVDFVQPLYSCVPVINSSFDNLNSLVVGNSKRTAILQGRTYLTS